MPYDLFSYAYLKSVGRIACFITAVALGKECGMDACGMNVECLRDAQTQKHEFFAGLWLITK